MVFTAFDVYVKLVEQSSHEIQIHRFAYILSELGLKVDFPGISKLEDASQYLAFIIPRILNVFNSTIGVVNSRNTEFAIWCAKHVSKKVG